MKWKNEEDWIRTELLGFCVSIHCWLCPYAMQRHFIYENEMGNIESDSKL